MKSKAIFKEFEKRAKNTARSRAKPERLGPPKVQAKPVDSGQARTSWPDSDIQIFDGDFLMTTATSGGQWKDNPPSSDLRQLLDTLKAKITKAINIPVEYLRPPPAFMPPGEFKMGTPEEEQAARYRVAMGLAPLSVAPVKDRRDYEIERLQSTLLAQDAVLKGLSKAAHMLGTVVAVRGERMTITNGAQHIDVALFAGAKVGDTVTLVPDSLQVLAVVPGATCPGSLATVQSNLPDGRVEVDYGGRRAVNTGDVACDAGDRVLLDPSLSVILQNLGKPKSVLSYEKATGTTWDDIGGQDEAKRVLRDAIETPKLHPELFAKYGRRPCKGVLLCGPPGTGKTLLARAAATSLAKTYGHDVSPGFIYVKGPALLSKWVGESESTIRAIFSAAREHKKIHGYQALVFIDECEAVLGRRGEDRGNILTQTMVPQFLAEMDGLEDSGALVLLATNRPDDLDPAVVRKGRIDRKVLVGRPRREDTERIAAIHLRDRPAAEGASLDELAATVAASVHDENIGVVIVGDSTVPLHLASFSSGAMVAGIVEDAAEAALARDVAAGTFSGITVSDIRAGARRAAQELVGTDLMETAMEVIRANPELLKAANDKDVKPSVSVHGLN